MNPNPLVSSTDIDEQAARIFLSENGWPVGLQNCFINNIRFTPVRYFVCDDSASMMAADGQKLVKVSGEQDIVSCSRMSELGSTLKFHGKLANAAKAYTEFHFLNTSAPIVIGTDNSDENFERLRDVCDGTPRGQTPLCRVIGNIIDKIKPMEVMLRDRGQKACVIIASDGEATDGSIYDALRPMCSLPVWLVIRLCTNEPKVVEYWNSVDSVLELDMDVIDDFADEAEQVHTYNPWLTYGEPLHRLREFGIRMKEIDLLDEKELAPELLQHFCAMLFNLDKDTMPHPELDAAGFVARVLGEASKLPPVFSAVDMKLQDWVTLVATPKTRTVTPQTSYEKRNARKMLGVDPDAPATSADGTCCRVS